MTQPTTRNSLLTLLLVSSAMFASVTHASDSKAVDSSQVKEAVQESKEGAKSSEDTVDTDGKGSEVGEASYNVETCEALIEEAENGESSDAGAEKLDLDKCQQLVK